MARKFTLDKIWPYLLILAIIFAWEFLVGGSSRGNFLFSKPSSVVSTFVKGMIDGPLPRDAFLSGYTTLAGAVIGLLVGIILSLTVLLFHRSVKGFESLLGVFSTIPILAIAPMFLVWFGTGLNMKIAISGYLAILLVAFEVFKAYDVTENEWGEFKSQNRAMQNHYIKAISIPITVENMLKRIPELVNVSFLGTFIGEFIAADAGLGYRVLRSSSLYQVDMVLAAAFLSVAVLLLMQYLLKLFSILAVKSLQFHSIPKIIKNELGDKKWQQ